MKKALNILGPWSIDELRKELVAQRDKLLQKYGHLKKTIREVGDDVTDAEEQSVNEYSRNLCGSLMDHDRAVLIQIKTAFARIADGTYGTCVACKETISDARLTALPYAERCRDCQDLTEQFAKHGISKEREEHERACLKALNDPPDVTN